MPSTLSDDRAPSSRLGPPGAQAAPTHLRAPPAHVGSLRWPAQLASGRPKVEEFALSTSRSLFYNRLGDASKLARCTGPLPCLRTAPHRPPRTIGRLRPLLRTSQCAAPAAWKLGSSPQPAPKMTTSGLPPPGMQRLVRRDRRARTLNHSRCSRTLSAAHIFGARDFHRDRPRSSPRARCPRCRSSRSTATRAASRRCRRRSGCAGRPSRRARRPGTCFSESDFAPTPVVLSKAERRNKPSR